MVSRGGWAGALVLAGLAGCVTPEWFRTAEKPSTEEQVFIGSLEWVAETSEAILRQRDIKFISAPEGDAVRIRGTTRKEGQFSLLLTRELRQPGQPEQTRVCLEWESGPKEPLQFFLFGTLDALGPR